MSLWPHSCKLVPNKLHVPLLRLMLVDVLLSRSSHSLKEHSDKQRKRGLDSPGLLCSTIPANASQSVSLQKAEACQWKKGEGRGQCVIRKKTVGSTT